MNEEIREILARLAAEQANPPAETPDTDVEAETEPQAPLLASLTDEELVALDDQFIAAIAEARDARDVALVRDLVEAVQAVRAEAEVRATADENADAEIDSVLAEVGLTADEDEVVGEDDDDEDDDAVGEFYTPDELAALTDDDIAAALSDENLAELADGDRELVAKAFSVGSAGKGVNTAISKLKGIKIPKPKVPGAQKLKSMSTKGKVATGVGSVGVGAGIATGAVAANRKRKSMAASAEVEEVAVEAPRPLRPVMERLAARLPVSATAASSTAMVASAGSQESPPVTIVAHADVLGHSAGAEVPWNKAGHVFGEKVHALKDARGPASYPVLQFQIEYPDDRQLFEGEEKDNTEKINAVVSAAAIHRRVAEAGGVEAINLANIRQTNLTARNPITGELFFRQDGDHSQNAIVAAGGLCAPVEASYDLHTLGTADRPIRDSFPRFQAKRGGIRFITPPSLADIPGSVTSNTAGDAVGVITTAQDAAGTPTKPCLTITCGTPVEVTVDAVYMCLQIGNFSRISFPEQFAAWHGLALTAHARVAETHLLDAMSSNSTAVTDGQNFGASRDFVEACARAANAYRSRHRMRPNDPLEVRLPFWFLAMMKVDLMRQAPGDQTLAVTDAQIAAMFANYNLVTIWYLDSRTGAGQVFGAQAAVALLGWPATVEAYISAPNSFTFLDMGTLDLGTEIRDTTMIAQNNVRAFMETFENLAKQGPQSLRLRMPACASGAASALVSYTCPGAGS